MTTSARRDSYRFALDLGEYAVLCCRADVVIGPYGGYDFWAVCQKDSFFIFYCHFPAIIPYPRHMLDPKGAE